MGWGACWRLFYQRGIGADSVTVHPTWVPHSHRRAAQLTLSALRAVRRLDADDVVHVHLSTRGSFIRKGAILAYASRRHLRDRRVTARRGFRAVRRPASLAGRTRVLRGLARVITALSDDAEAVARRLAPDALGAPDPESGVDPRTGVAGVSATDSVALFAGEIGIRKGADVLERAWAIVHDALPEARCIVIGPDGDFTREPPRA